MRDLEITRILPLDASASRDVTVRLGSDSGELTITSRQRLSADAPTAHATSDTNPR